MWPRSVREVEHSRLRNEEFDLVLLQRLREIALVERLTGKRPGRDIPAIYVEHNTPGGNTPYTVHPLANPRQIPVVHVTHFNNLVSPVHVVRMPCPLPRCGPRPACPPGFEARCRASRAPSTTHELHTRRDHVTESSRGQQIRRSLEQQQATEGPKETLIVPLRRGSAVRRPNLCPQTILTAPDGRGRGRRTGHSPSYPVAGLA